MREERKNLLHDIAKKAEEFSKEHVVAMSGELIEWSSTGILKDGRVRELAHILHELAGPNALTVAESYAKSAAFEFVVQQGKRNG